MQAYGLSADEIVQAMSSANVVSPSGNMNLGDTYPIVPINAVVKNIKDLEGVPLRATSRGSVFLRGVATVEDGSDLASRQLVRASESAFASRRREIIFLAASAYFDLSRAQASVAAAIEAAHFADEHAKQAVAAVDAGLVFKGDAYRLTASQNRSEVIVRQLREEQRITAARLAELLHLDPAVDLVPAQDELPPLSLTAPGEPLGPLIAHALATRPELDDAKARMEAAKIALRGANYGPLIPTIGARAYYGGLGGGVGSAPLDRDFNSSEDYLLALSWRIGPGVLFDRSRQMTAQSHERTSAREVEKVHDQIRRQVVELHTRLKSLADQLVLIRKALDAADQTAKLSRERNSLGVSEILEDLQAEEELARTRRDYLATIAEYNKAQDALKFALGDQ